MDIKKKIRVKCNKLDRVTFKIETKDGCYVGETETTPINFNKDEYEVSAVMKGTKCKIPYFLNIKTEDGTDPENLVFYIDNARGTSESAGNCVYGEKAFEFDEIKNWSVTSTGYEYKSSTPLTNFIVYSHTKYLIGESIVLMKSNVFNLRVGFISGKFEDGDGVSVSNNGISVGNGFKFNKDDGSVYVNSCKVGDVITVVFKRGKNTRRVDVPITVEMINNRGNDYVIINITSMSFILNVNVPSSIPNIGGSYELKTTPSDVVITSITSDGGSWANLSIDKKKLIVDPNLTGSERTSNLIVKTSNYGDSFLSIKQDGGFDVSIDLGSAGSEDEEPMVPNTGGKYLISTVPNGIDLCLSSENVPFVEMSETEKNTIIIKENDSAFNRRMTLFFSPVINENAYASLSLVQMGNRNQPTLDDVLNDNETTIDDEELTPGT